MSKQMDGLHAVLVAAIALVCGAFLFASRPQASSPAGRPVLPEIWQTAQAEHRLFSSGTRRWHHFTGLVKELSRLSSIFTLHKWCRRLAALFLDAARGIRCGISFSAVKNPFGSLECPAAK